MGVVGDAAVRPGARLPVDLCRPGGSTPIALCLQANPVIQETVATLLVSFAITANARWEDVPAIQRPLARAGSRLARWLPTFLIIDGPLGRVVRDADSPLNAVLRNRHESYPVLARGTRSLQRRLLSARAQWVRHWSFVWRDTEHGPQIEIVDWKTGKTPTTLTLLEAEALHVASFSAIEALEHVGDTLSAE